ncbi:hypothetical protein LWI29_021202 [Acer saccharum]|uniref:SLC26A/SulP transporter domain-containing protein n=1 Tax=Acer saccharum TaxID=4024 RepID=A0AA39V8Y8_ACESA|nr:hypothetical protein LWI29_021202 [Acer saccharum]
MVKQIDISKDFDHLIGHVVGPDEASSSVLLDITQPRLGEGPGNDNYKHSPSNIGLALIVEGCGQRVEIKESNKVGVCKPGKWRRVVQPSRAGPGGEKFGELLGKRRNVEQGIEEGKRSRKDSVVANEEILASSDCILGDSQRMAEVMEIGSYRDGNSLVTDRRSLEDGISYAKLAHLPPIIGLYSSFVPPLIYSVLGSSRHMGIGPVSIASLVMGTMLNEEVSFDKDRDLYLQLAFTSTLFAGLFQASLGLFRSIVIAF